MHHSLEHVQAGLVAVVHVPQLLTLVQDQDVKNGEEMLTDTDITYFRGEGNVDGVALVWVIDEDCLYDIPTYQEHADMFLSSDQVIDISSDYPDHDGLTLRFMKNDTIVNELQTSEYFGSILLSNPLVINLLDYPYGRYVISPDAKFDGEQFIITDRNVTGYLP
jgi:hypothetical protein